MYIFGWPVAQAIASVAMAKNLTLGPVVFFLLTMLVIVPMGLLSWKLIERPVLSLKKYFLPARKVANLG